MISERKKYIIKLFLKKCTDIDLIKSCIDFSLDLMATRYQLSIDSIRELKQKHSIDDYIEGVTPIIDSQFSIEEMQEIIRFFSLGSGKKMMDKQFLQKIGKVGDSIISKAEQEFASRNERN